MAAASAAQITLFWVAMIRGERLLNRHAERLRALGPHTEMTAGRDGYCGAE
jgi:hypothetical protein